LALTEGEEVIAFRLAKEDPYKLFYARPGASAQRLGINSAGRIFRRYRIRKYAPALESFTTGVVDTRTPLGQGQRGPVMAHGGSIQLIIPNADTVLSMLY
jgi:hypothetical protein